MLARQAGAGQRLTHRFHHIVARKLNARYVDAHLDSAGSADGAVPFGQLLAGCVESPAAQRQDKAGILGQRNERSEEHTSELQSLMRISNAVFCLKKKKKTIQQNRKI